MTAPEFIAEVGELAHFARSLKKMSSKMREMEGRRKKNFVAKMVQ
jgi:hypothetical protein